MFPHPFFVNMSFVGAGGQIKFHCAMKEIYEMPQMNVVEMEIQNGIMQDPSPADGGGEIPPFGD